jgi:hypothetical protein
LIGSVLWRRRGAGRQDQERTLRLQATAADRRAHERQDGGDVAKLAEKMVETGKNRTFPLVYRLIELTLILPVATASVERIFSAMNIIKTDLRNRVSDEWFNDLMICYTEREIFRSLDDRMIMERFQAMTKRRMALPTIRITTT